jgi:uncharacterized protein
MRDRGIVQPGWNAPPEDACFHVVVHDVAPAFLGEISTILDELRPLVGGRVSAGVVPRWHGRTMDAAEAGTLARFVRGGFDEVLLHGWEHRQSRPNGVVSALTLMSNEFGGLPFTTALARVVDGYERVAALTGRAPSGFIAPAWDRGPVSLRLLRACGLDFYVGMTELERPSLPGVPLSTWSWDSGAIAQLGHLGDWAGHLMFAVRPRSVPCVVFHPKDVERGFLARGVRLIRALLDAGRRPVPFEALAKPEVPLAA